VAAACLVGLAAPVQAVKYDSARAAFDIGDYARAERLLAAEITENPGHQEAYRIWADCLEKLGNVQAAIDAWSTVKTITADDGLETLARRNMLRLQRVLRSEGSSQAKWEDPFAVPDLDIDYEGLDEVDSTDYRPVPGSGLKSAPPILHETQHFSIYACSERLAKNTAELCEKYLAFLLERLLAGRAWPHRVPVFLFQNKDDYVKVGGMPAGSGGVAFQDRFGRTAGIAGYQLTDEDIVEQAGYKNRVSNTLEDVLPHELTHMVINEFFGAQDIPRWMNEGCARQMEQSRKDHEEAAALARDAVAGEYFRFRDLAGMKIYPTGGQNMRFYEQSAPIITYILEQQGPEGMRAFLTELASGNDHDAAVAAAFGIPEEGAVEALEKMWVEWMKERYVKDLKRDDREDPTVASESDSELFRSPFDELESVKTVEKWRPVKPEAPGECRGIGDSLRYWTLSPEAIQSKLPDERSQSMLAVRMYEELPIAIKCRVRWTGDEDENLGWFGFAVLDAQVEDMGVQVLTRLEDNRARDVTCVIADDIAVYLDGRCTGRYPVPPWPDDVEVDYPVALVTHSPVEVTDFQVATIDKFKEAAAEDADKGRRGRGRSAGGKSGGDDGGKGTKPKPKTGKGKKKPPKKKKKSKPKKPPKRVGPGVS
jgi:hypothetical protein